MLKSKIQKKKIVFLGASITQGRISANFVQMLKKQTGTGKYTYINQGVAGYETYNILTKLHKAVRTDPDFVFILVGTNDVQSSMDPELARLSRKLKKIPHEPTLDHFIRNMTEIVKRLKQETRAEIAVISLPVLGENLESTANRQIDTYNAALKKISETEGIHYLPANEKQKRYLLDKNHGKGKDIVQGTRMAFRSLIRHYLLRKTLDAISAENGYLLLTDGIHLNTRGAEIITDEIKGFLTNNS